MSKKDRLKKQSLQQLEAKKAARQEEENERKTAGESSAAKKLRRNAKKHNGAETLILKILMCVPFIWSGICYNIIFLMGISMDQIQDVPGRMSVYLGVGALICLAGLIFAFLSKYIVQFALIFVGSMMFMHAARFIVGKAQELISAGHGLTESQMGLASKWRWGLYPILVMTAFSAALMLIYLLRRRAAKLRLRREYDNSPTKSIIG